MSRVVIHHRLARINHVLFRCHTDLVFKPTPVGSGTHSGKRMHPNGWTNIVSTSFQLGPPRDQPKVGYDPSYFHGHRGTKLAPVFLMGHNPSQTADVSMLLETPVVEIQVTRRTVLVYQ
jgi:hypothetical protein